MKSQGTIGASMQCLFQNTPKKGVDCPVGDYRRLFNEIATRITKQIGFQLLDDGTWAAIECS
jgi:hypothetical protein